MLVTCLLNETHGRALFREISGRDVRHKGRVPPESFDAESDRDISDPTNGH